MGELLLFLTLATVGLAGPPPTEDAQAKTLPDLVSAFDYTFRQILTPEEYELFRTKLPEEIAQASPDLYEKIRQNVKRWTDDWIKTVPAQFESLPEERLAEAVAAAHRIDALLRRHFEVRSWPYRSMRVVFLPQRMFHVPTRIARDPTTAFGYEDIKGMFIPFYPEVFFTTVQPSSPTSLVLVHESLHYNAKDTRLGRRLCEGITEAAARRIARDNGLVSDRELREFSAYVEERDLVEVIQRGIVDRTARAPADALDLLVTCYITGDHAGLRQIFGAEAWDRLVDLSRDHKTWHQLESGVKQTVGKR
jgi:uncharacterized protein (DUF2267 family)